MGKQLFGDSRDLFEKTREQVSRNLRECSSRGNSRCTGSSCKLGEQRPSEEGVGTGQEGEHWGANPALHSPLQPTRQTPAQSMPKPPYSVTARPSSLSQDATSVPTVHHGQPESPTARPSREPSFQQSARFCPVPGTTSGPPTALILDQPVLHVPKPGDTGVSGPSTGIQAQCWNGATTLRCQSHILVRSCGPHGLLPAEWPLSWYWGRDLITKADFLGLGLGDSRGWLREGLRT